MFNRSLFLKPKKNDTKWKKIWNIPLNVIRLQRQCVRNGICVHNEQHNTNEHCEQKSTRRLLSVLVTLSFVMPSQQCFFCDRNKAFNIINSNLMKMLGSHKTHRWHRTQKMNCCSKLNMCTEMRSIRFYRNKWTALLEKLLLYIHIFDSLEKKK